MKRRWFLISVSFSVFLIIYFYYFVSKETVNRPNIVFILTDDQDLTLDGMVPLKKTRKHFAEHGVKFLNAVLINVFTSYLFANKSIGVQKCRYIENYNLRDTNYSIINFTAVPICCPSRASILTGLYQHNHRVLNNSIDGNCYGNEWREHHERRTFAAYLKDNGYVTFFAGKYMNQYGIHREKISAFEVPHGWTYWNGLIGNSVYYNYTLSVNGHMENHGSKPEDYLTDLINERATRFLLDRDVNSEPFFALLSTPSCHAPFQASVKYEGAYGKLKAPRTPNFNMSGGPNKHWLLRQTPDVLPINSVKSLDRIFGRRWATLLSVDDLVSNVVNVLRAKGMLDNTYIVFASDNGYHLGQFSLPIDKRQMYEFDVRVPLLVSGPGVHHGGEKREPVVNIDLAPTFLDLAGIEIPSDMDGKSLVPLLSSDNDFKLPWRDSFLIEYHGEGRKPSESSGCPQYKLGGVSQCFPDCICEDAVNNTYTCLRTITTNLNFIRCDFEDDEKFVEIYNLDKDPHQLINLHLLVGSAVNTSPLPWNNREFDRLRTCRGRMCH